MGAALILPLVQAELQVLPIEVKAIKVVVGYIGHLFHKNAAKVPGSVVATPEITTAQALASPSPTVQTQAVTLTLDDLQKFEPLVLLLLQEFTGAQVASPAQAAQYKKFVDLAVQTVSAGLALMQPKA